MRLVRNNLAGQDAQPDEATVASKIARYRISPITHYVIRPLVLTAVILSLVTAVLLVINNVQSNRWLGLLPLLAIVILEAIYTTQWASHPNRLVLDHSLYRAAELFLVLLFMRVATWFVFQEGTLSIEQAMLYLRNPGALFLTPGFIIAAILTIIVWRVAIVLSRTFTQLELSEFELRYFSLPLSVRKAMIDDEPIQIGRKELAATYLRYWLIGGILLAIFVGLSTLDLAGYRPTNSMWAIRRLGLQPAVLAALLIYFLGGFWLMSQARLSELNARWMINGVEKSAQVESSWQRNSLLLLGLIALIAAFIPIGPALPIAAILNYVLTIFFFIVNAVFYAITLVVALILSVFGPGGEPEVSESTPPPALDAQPPQQQQQPPLSDTAAMLTSSAFWSILIVVAIIAILYFLRERDERPSREGVRLLWNRFKVWLGMLWENLRTRAAAVQLNLAALRSRTPSHSKGSTSGRPAWRFIRVNALSPRDQIRYFYLSTVKRASQKGVQRAKSETPIEYIDDLRAAWPDAEEEIEDLTDAFLWARYSPKPIDKDEVGLVKRTWRQVKANMRKQKEEETTNSESPNTEA